MALTVSGEGNRTITGKHAYPIDTEISITGEIAAGISTVRGLKLGGESLKGEV